jgi:hypothetical protein
VSRHYDFEVPGLKTVLSVDRLRRERQELIGELSVHTLLPGAKTVNGYLSVADFNFSSQRARSERAKHLAERAGTNGQFDWQRVLEDFCQQVFAAERLGEPAIDLRTLPRPSKNELQVCGFTFPRDLPSILFGDGGSAKSYTALFLAGEMTKLGINVGLFDWEMAGEQHRERLQMLYGLEMPSIQYCRCERPLIYEADRIRRIIQEKKIGYAIFDSVAFACDGPPEEAETAGKYFRAIRELPCGSLHIAHSTKGENNDRKPFGSVFWFNGARAIWHVEATETVDEGKSLSLGFVQRKANTGPLGAPIAYRLEFSENGTQFIREDAMGNPLIASKLTIRQRMHFLLKHGSMPIEELAQEIEADANTIERTARRYRREFILLSGKRLGLAGES